MKATLQGPPRPYVDLDEFLAEMVRLFEREPELPKQLQSVLLGYEARNEVSALVDYLFIRASGPASGTEYNVVGYRLRSADERKIAERTFVGQKVIHYGHRNRLPDSPLTGGDPC